MLGRIERTELRIPLTQLRHDTPVDQAHVQVLARSLRNQGQLSPLLIWTGGGANNEALPIIDGFHRRENLASIGEDSAVCSLVELSTDQFRDARIASAVMHKGVVFTRVVTWAREIFRDTPWSSKVKAAEAFNIDHQPANKRSLRNALEAGLTIAEAREMWDWVRERSEVWGLAPEQIANMLNIADLAAPSLISLVRQPQKSTPGLLTRTVLSNLVQRIPDHQLQEALVRKAQAEALSKTQVKALILQVAHQTDSQLRQELLSTSWLDTLRLKQESLRDRTRSTITPEEVQRGNERFRIEMAIGKVLCKQSTWEVD